MALRIDHDEVHVLGLIAPIHRGAVVHQSLSHGTLSSQPVRCASINGKDRSFTSVVMLDDGRLTSTKPWVVNFKNTIIIMTSNIGSHNLSRAREALRSDGGIIQENLENLERKDVDAMVEKMRAR